MTTNLAFVITESFTFHFYLEKWIVPLSYDYNIHIIGNFSDVEIANLVKKFSMYSITFHAIDIQRKISWKSDFLSIFRIRKKILKFENLILFSLMPKANFLTSLCVLFTRRIKFSPIVTGSIWLNYPTTSIKYYFFRMVEGFIFWMADIVIFDSPSQKKLALKTSLTPLNRSKFKSTMSFGGIDIDAFSLCNEKKILFRESIQASPDKKIVMHFSRLCVRKGTLEFLKMADCVIKKLKNDSPIFCIFGPVEEKAILKSIISFKQKYGDKIVFKNDVFTNIDELLNGPDILVVPSRWEGFGLIPAMAASTGTPSVGFNVVGLQDSIRHGVTGYLANPYDVDELSEYVILLLKNDIKYSEVSISAQNYAKSFFSTDIFLTDFKNLCIELSLINK